MNIYYIFAIICTALAALFGFLGNELSSQTQARKNSENQAQSSKRIEDKLNQLGSKLADVKQEENGGLQQDELKKLRKEYSEIAKSFYDALPIEIQKEKAKKADLTIAQLTQSKEIEKHVKGLEKSLSAMIEGFNDASPRPKLNIQVKNFPENIFTALDQYRLLISFDDTFYWFIRFVRYSQTNGPIALQVVRVSGSANASINDNFQLTNDSINLVFYNDDQFGISLNSDIRKDVLDNVFKDTPSKKYLMNEFDSTVNRIFEKIIKLEILRKSTL